METSKEMIDELLSHCKPNKITLEPSAGYGLISTRLVKDMSCIVDVCELNKDRVQVLDNQHLYRNTYNEDFLTIHITHKYDQIVAVPPYKDNVDCEHIIKMYSLLAPKGKIITFTLPYWVTGIYSNQVKFRQWLADKQYSIKLFEDQSYISCPKMLLIVQK